MLDPSIEGTEHFSKARMDANLVHCEEDQEAGEEDNENDWLVLMPRDRTYRVPMSPSLPA